MAQAINVYPKENIALRYLKIVNEEKKILKIKSTMKGKLSEALEIALPILEKQHEKRMKK